MDSNSPPRVWVLLGKGKGGNGQMLSLARALGWPYETFQLVHNPLNLIPNILLGATNITLNKKRSEPFTSPWPDLVIAASRRATPVALWIRKQSRGRARLVHLLHVQAPLHWFDLIITLPQYRLPKRENILHNIGPLNQINLQGAKEMTVDWQQRLDGMSRPYTVLLVGGNSSAYEFDAQAADKLAREASSEVIQRGGTLLVTTSPRTPPKSSAALQAALDCPNFFYHWMPDDRNNPYSAFLSLADNLIVTADSASLLAEASQTGKPVKLFRWQLQASSRIARLQKSNDAGLKTKLFNALVYYGLIKPRRDFNAYHEAMIERGLVSVLGDVDSGGHRQPLDDMDRAVKRIRELFAAPV